MEGYIEVNPLSNVPKPKVTERVIPMLEDDDLRKLNLLCDPKLYNHRADIIRAVRNRAALWLLKDSPGRRRELTDLTVDEVDLRERRVPALGKRRRQWYMHLGAVTTKALYEYKLLRDALDPGPTIGGWTPRASLWNRSG